MLLFVTALALQGKPGLARTWASAVGLGDATLTLTADGRFTAVTRPKNKPKQILRGTYAVGPVPSNARKGKLVHAQTILFVYDLASLKALGAPKAQLDALKAQGKPGQVGMRLYYIPEFPLLSDLARSHFVDAKDRAAASKRLLKWRPF